jgi:hypothetical protein
MTVVKEYIERNDQLQTPTTLRVGRDSLPVRNA